MANNHEIAIRLVKQKIRQIRVRKVPFVASKALRHMARKYSRDKNIPYNPYEANEATLKRWTVNYIRHYLTNYDKELWAIPDVPEREEAYRKYKRAVLSAIAKAYPELRDECERQKESGYVSQQAGCL